MNDGAKTLPSSWGARPLAASLEGSAASACGDPSRRRASARPSGWRRSAWQLGPGVSRCSASQGLRHSASKTRVNALMASRPRHEDAPDR